MTNSNMLIVGTIFFLFSQIGNSTQIIAADARLETTLKLLKDRDPKKRLLAITQLVDNGGVTKEVSRGLCDAVLDPSPAVATAALQAIEKVNPVLYKQVSVIAVDRSVYNRDKAITEIGLLGEKGAPALSLVMANLRRELSQPRFGGGVDINDSAMNSAYTIFLIDPENQEVPRIFAGIAGGANPSVEGRSKALKLLSGWAGSDEKRVKEVVPIYIAGLSNVYMQKECIIALESYGKLALKAVPFLQKLKLSPDAGIREAASAAVAKLELLELPQEK